MAQIRDTYSAQISADAPLGGRVANPTDFGGTGTTDLGTGVQSFGHSAGQAQRILLQNKMRQEATHADTTTMKANAELTLELNRMAREWKPGDADITETFHGMVRDKFTALQLNEDGESRYETAQGQRHYENRAAHYSSQFAVESAKVQAHLDGLAAVAEHGQMVDTSANMLHNQPAYFQSERDTVEATIRNPNGIYYRPGITELDRDKLVRQSDEALATSTVLGTIRQTPNLALEKLGKGWMATYVPKEKYGTLIEHAKTAVHALSVDADRAHKEAEWARVEKARGIENTLFNKMAAHDAVPDKNPPLTAQDLQDSQLGLYDPGKYGAMLGVLHTRSREKLSGVTTDPGVMRNLFNRIHLPENDPKKITDELPLNLSYGRDGKLSFEDFGRLRKELADARTPEGSKLGVEKANFLKSRTSGITHSNMLLGKLDSEGDAKLGDFTYMVDRKVEEYRKAGKDPHDLFNPSKPDFLGKPEALRPYQKTLQESMHTMSEKIQAKAPDRLPPEEMRRPNETFKQWKDRQPTNRP